MSTSSVNSTGLAILNAYQNYASAGPEGYSPIGIGGFNSNSFISGLLLAAGLSQSTVDRINADLAGMSGLDPIDADAGAGMVDDFGGGSGGDDGNGHLLYT